MAQQGIWPAVPNIITGANTTDFDKYVGATKGGIGAAKYILCVLSNTVSQPAGAAVNTATATASTAFEPWIVAPTSGAAVEHVGLLADSAPVGPVLAWVQIAGLATVSCTSAALTAYSVALAQTDTANSYVTAAFSIGVPGASSHAMTFGVGPLDKKILINARFKPASAASTIATVLIVPRSVNVVTAAAS